MNELIANKTPCEILPASLKCDKKTYLRVNDISCWMDKYKLYGTFTNFFFLIEISCTSAKEYFKTAEWQIALEICYPSFCLPKIVWKLIINSKLDYSAVDDRSWKCFLYLITMAYNLFNQLRSFSKREFFVTSAPTIYILKYWFVLVSSVSVQ